MKYLAKENIQEDTGDKSFEQSLEERYREAVQLDLFHQEEVSQMCRVLAFLKELGRSPKRS